MTDIDSLPAGPEMDRLVHERIMLNRVLPDGSRTTMGCLSAGSWSPSTNIAHAWEVVEKSHPNAWFLWWDDGHAEWACFLDGARSVLEGCRIKAWADTAPLAICRAALRAVG